MKPMTEAELIAFVQGFYTGRVMEQAEPGSDNIEQALLVCRYYDVSADELRAALLATYRTEQEHISGGGPLRGDVPEQ